MAQQLTDALTDVADDLLSEKTICKHSKPWIDTEIIEKLREQRAAKKKWKRRRSPRNYEKYTELVDQTEKMISEAKDRWWTAEIKRLEEAPQEKKWKILDQITNPQLRMGIQPVKVDGSYVFSDEEILEQMEKVHVRKGDCCNDVDEDVVNNLQLDIETARNQCIEDDDDDLNNTMITIDEVESTFGKCSNTAGSDGITAAMIDNAHREKMTECLHHLWNSIWAENKIPAQWKLENRKLIPKAGKDSYNECEAYRTVSITALLGKRLEKIISARLTCYLESQAFDENQFAYWKGRSSTQAVLKLVEEVKRNMHQNCVTGVLFFDFSDAFGTVNRAKLLYKLRTHFNVSGRLFLYLVSFLSERKARITVNDLIGEWIESDHGTSAGTILGAILFLVYVHDTPPGIQPKFADDLAASVSGKDVASVQHELQNRLDELEKWSTEWNMRLNTAKTKGDDFHKTRQATEYHIDASK